MIVPDISREFPITIFLSAIMFTSFVASGLFFLKFWKKTQERFFLFFAFASWAIAIERIPILIYRTDLESHTWIYIFRLGAFILILLAAYHANRQRKKSHS